MKSIQIAAATAALMLSSLQAQAGPYRAELLAGRDNNQQGRGYDDRRVAGRHADGPVHRSLHNRGTEHRQHHYDNARRYAAAAVRQAREAYNLGYYSDHPRWSPDFQRHFSWALRADAWKMEREARRRAKTLRELRRHAHYDFGRRR